MKFTNTGALWNRLVGDTSPCTERCRQPVHCLPRCRLPIQATWTEPYYDVAGARVAGTLLLEAPGPTIFRYGTAVAYS